MNVYCNAVYNTEELDMAFSFKKRGGVAEVMIVVSKIQCILEMYLLT